MEIVWSNSSKKDLRTFFENIHKGTEKQANNYIMNIVKYVELLKISPYIGKVLFVHDNLEYRQLVYRKHKIIYSITDNINILSVIHTSRNIQNLISKIKF